jgi:hypothetical protein
LLDIAYQPVVQFFAGLPAENCLGRRCAGAGGRGAVDAEDAVSIALAASARLRERRWKPRDCATATLMASQSRKWFSLRIFTHVANPEGFGTRASAVNCRQ